jgi:prolyl-tRNA synthetase
MKAGLEKGYIGPYKTPDDLKIIFDNEIKENEPYCVGAQENGFHLNGFVIGRDYKNPEFVDLRQAKSGDNCSNCGEKVDEKKGIEVGHIFQLGDKYTRAMDVSVLDQNGKPVIPSMGCYGLGISRTAAAAVEQCHDENGIVWPKSIAPYQIYFVVIGKAQEFFDKANEIYEDLLSHGYEVIMDDRKMGPGGKFKDADLLGIPLRLVLGERDFNSDQTLELKPRTGGDAVKVKVEQLLETIKQYLAE